MVCVVRLLRFLSLFLWWQPGFGQDVDACVGSCDDAMDVATVDQTEEDEAKAARLGLLQVRLQKEEGNETLLEKAYMQASLKDRLAFLHQRFTTVPAMVAAFRLKLFDAIPVEGGMTFDEIVQRTNSSVRGMDTLLGAMLDVGAVRYENDTTKFYNEYSKGQLKDADFWKHLEIDLRGESVAMQRQSYYIADSVVQDRAVGLTEVLGDYDSLYSARADLPEIAEEWDTWMNGHDDNLAERMSFVYDLPSVVARIGKNSKEFNGHVLDWCGNDGKNAIQLAKSDPTMKLTVLDLPEQAAKAAVNIEAAGLQHQLDTMGADLSDDNVTFEHKYDAVFMIHMVKEWPGHAISRFFKTIHSILKPGGILLIFPHNEVDDDRVEGDFSTFDAHPLKSNYHALYMLISASHTSYTKTGDELVGMLTQAGFVDAISNSTSEDNFIAAAKPSTEPPTL